MFFLISALVLGYLLYWTYRKDVPKFIHAFYRSQRRFNDKKDGKKPTLIGFFFFLLMIIISFSIWNILSPFFEAAELRVGYTAGFTFAFSMVFWIVVLKNFSNRFSYYYITLRDQELQEEIRLDHDVVGWGDQNDVAHAFSHGTNLSGVNVCGVHFGKFSKKGHILTVGPARAGKGTSLLLPPLLDSTLRDENAPSFVVLDPRGENLAVSGDVLKKNGYEIVVLNPYSIPEIDRFGNSHFNPFDLFDEKSPDFNKYVDLIRYSIIPRSNEKHANSYFSEAASDLLSLYIRHLMTQDEEPKNITTLYRWLRLGGMDRAKLLKRMEENEKFDVSYDAAAIAQQLVEGGKSITDVYGNVTVAIGDFKDQQIRESMSKSDFNLKDIAHKKTALFICLGAEDLDRMKVWLRIVVSALMRGFIRNYNIDRKVVMLLDEFSSMGQISEFSNVQYLANYNVTAWIVIQDLNQIKNLYPRDWEGFINNTVIRHWFAPGDNFTAEYISKRMPSDLQFIGKHEDGTPKYKEKPLLTMSEVQSFPDIIMEVSDHPRPIRLEKIPYWEFIREYTPNPFYKNPK